MPYRFLPHTADIRVALEAPDLATLYRDAVALVRELVVGASPVEPRTARTLAVAGADGAETLLNFLRDLLFAYETEAFVPAALEVAAAEERAVRGTVRGERFDPARHEAEPEVKAVTRHGLTLERTDGGWRAEVVFDM